MIDGNMVGIQSPTVSWRYNTGADIMEYKVIFTKNMRWIHPK
jgi:hypothetical protein